MKLAVLGDGGWGTALAIVSARNEHEVSVWGPFSDQINSIRSEGENKQFLPGVHLPESIDWTSDMKEAVNGADGVLVVVPSRFYRSTVEQLKPFLQDGQRVVSATKGLDESSYSTMSTVASTVLGREVAVLSGPSHAEEVARGIPCAVACAATALAEAEWVQAALMQENFRVYTSTDVKGVELGGALKNVVAIAAGISDGLGFGDNTKAALMTRGLAEMTRLGVALGAQVETFSGLSGLGDLMVTCMSRHSRNRGVGERLGKGESLEEIMEGMQMVAEGVWNCRAACSLGASVGIDLPIAEQVQAVVHEGVEAREAMMALMERAPRSEAE
jgi:glycerol-3-phosphate dehydrogenase (NAD(P)+)